jgi:hypothetical protein
MKEQTKLDEDFHALLFGVKKSVRYHTRRRQFFDRLGYIANFLIIITGGGTLYSVSNESHHFLTVVFGALVAVFSAIDLIIGCSNVARDHHDLARDFSELQRQMVAAGENPTEAQFIAFTNRRLEIEDEEPPKLCVLDVLCHNELIESGGYGDNYKRPIGWIHTCLAQVGDFWCRIPKPNQKPSHAP